MTLGEKVEEHMEWLAGEFNALHDKLNVIRDNSVKEWAMALSPEERVKLAKELLVGTSDEWRLG